MTKFGPITVDGPQPATDREKLILRAIADPGAFCRRQRWRDDFTDGYVYEPVPAWGARAVVIALAGEAAVVEAAKEWRKTQAVSWVHERELRQQAMDRLADAVEALGKGGKP